MFKPPRQKSKIFATPPREGNFQSFYSKFRKPAILLFLFLSL